jgi:hypothetical protein
MKIPAAALLSVAALTAACAPADVNPSASPSQDLSAVVLPDEMPPLTLSAGATKGYATVGDRVLFDLTNPSSWTIVSDTAAGILELRTGATLEATIVGSGEATVTFTDGSATVTFTVTVR